MKVLFIIGSSDPGGTETYLLRFLQYLNFKYQVFILGASGKSGLLSSEYKKYGAEFLCFRLGSTNPFLWIRFFLFLLKNRFDVICDFNGNFAGINMLIAYLTRHKKRIVFYRQTNDLCKNKFLFFFSKNAIVNKLVYYYSTSILSNSKMAFDVFFKNKIDQRFKVIYNGIDASIFNVSESKEEIRKELKIPQNAFVIGNTARFHPVKNHHTILKVAEILCSKYPDIYFVLCGRGVKEALLTEIIRRKLETRIIIFDGRNDIPKVLKSFDMYYFPSYSEGQPNSFIEAMFSRLPIVVSNIPSIIETIPTFLRGQTVQPFDYETTLNLILDIYNGNYSPSILEDTFQYVSEKFNKDKRFSEFENILN